MKLINKKILSTFKNVHLEKSKNHLNSVKSKTTTENSLLKEAVEQFDVFFNFSFDKGRLKSFVVWFLKTYGESKTIVLLEKLKEIGFGYATKAGISLGIDDLRIPPEKTQLLDKADRKTSEGDLRYIKGAITAVERLQNFMNVWHETSENLKKEVVNHFEATDILNPVYMMAFSGARGNLSQVRQLVGMRGLMADPQGQIIDFPIRSNFREGLTLTEYVISTYGARKGIVDTALRTANAGYLTRRLVDVAQHVIVSEFDCKTHRGIFIFDMKEGTKTIYPLQQRLIGRVLAEDVFSGDTKIASRNEEISKQSSEMLTKLYKKFLIRSPLTCATKTFVCQLCYGWSLATNRLVPIGEAVGVIAGQSIGEPGTQLTMRTFHTGGVFSGGISDQITAQYDSIVEYPIAMVGNCVRTPQGEIAFLTKTSGYMILKPAENQKKQKLSTFSLTDDTNNVFNAVAKVLKVPPYSLLFARNGQYMFKEQLIALLSSVGLQETQTMYSEQILYSDREGEVYTSNMEILELTVNQSIRIKPGSENIPKQLQFVTKDWSELVILAGKNYQLPVDSNLFPYAGDFISSNSILNKIGWTPPENCILQKEEQIGTNSFLSKIQNLGPGLQHFSSPLLNQTEKRKNQIYIASERREDLYNINKTNSSVKSKMQKRFYKFKYKNSARFLLKTQTFNRQFQFPVFVTASPKFTKAILKETNFKTNQTLIINQKTAVNKTSNIDQSIQDYYNVPSLLYIYKKASCFPCSSENHKKGVGVKKLTLRRNSMAKRSKIDLNPFLQNQKHLLNDKFFDKNDHQIFKTKIFLTMYSNNFIRQTFFSLPIVNTSNRSHYFLKNKVGTKKQLLNLSFLNNNTNQLSTYIKKKENLDLAKTSNIYYPFQTFNYGNISTNTMKEKFFKNLKVFKFKKSKIRRMFFQKKYHFTMRYFMFLNRQNRKVWSKKTMKVSLLKPSYNFFENKRQNLLFSPSSLYRFVSKKKIKKRNFLSHRVFSFLKNPLVPYRKAINSFLFFSSEFSKSNKNYLLLNNRLNLYKKKFFENKFSSLTLKKPILSLSLTNVYFQKYGYNFSLDLKTCYTGKKQFRSKEGMISFSGLNSSHFSSSDTKTALNTYNWKPNTELSLKWIPNKSVSFNGGLFLKSSYNFTSPLEHQLQKAVGKWQFDNKRQIAAFSLRQEKKRANTQAKKNKFDLNNKTAVVLAKENNLTALNYKIVEKNQILNFLKFQDNFKNFHTPHSLEFINHVFSKGNCLSTLLFLLKKQVLIHNSYFYSQTYLLQKNKNDTVSQVLIPDFISKNNLNYLCSTNASVFNNYSKGISFSFFSVPIFFWKKEKAVQMNENLKKFKEKTFNNLMQQVSLNVLAKTSLGNYTTQTKFLSRFYFIMDKFVLIHDTKQKILENKKPLSFQKKLTKSFKHSFLFIRPIQSYFSISWSYQPTMHVFNITLNQTKRLLLQKKPYKQKPLFQRKMSFDKVYQKETLNVKDVLSFPYVKNDHKTYYYFSKPKKSFNEQFLLLHKPSHQPTFTKNGIFQSIKNYTTTIFGQSNSKEAKKNNLIFCKFNQEKNNKSFSLTSTKNFLNFEKHIVKTKENILVFSKPLYTDQRKFAKMLLTTSQPSASNLSTNISERNITQTDDTKLKSKLSVYHNEVLWLPQEKYKLFTFSQLFSNIIKQNENRLNFSLNSKSCYFVVNKGTPVVELVNRQGKKQSHVSTCNGIMKISLDSVILSKKINTSLFKSLFGVFGLQTFSIKKQNVTSAHILGNLYKNSGLKNSSVSIFNKPPADFLFPEEFLDFKIKENKKKKQFGFVKEQQLRNTKRFLNLPFSQTTKVSLKTKEHLTTPKSKKLQRYVKSKLNVYMFNAIISKFYNLTNVNFQEKKVKALKTYSLQKFFVNQTKDLVHFLFRKKPTHNYFEFKRNTNKTKLIPYLEKFVSSHYQNKFINIEIQQGWVYFSSKPLLQSLTKYEQTKYCKTTNFKDLTTKHESIFTPGKVIFDDVSFDRTYVYTKCISLNKINIQLMNKEDFIELQKNKNCTIPFTKIDKIIQNKKCRFKPSIFVPLKLPYLNPEKEKANLKNNLNSSNSLNTLTGESNKQFSTGKNQTKSKLKKFQKEQTQSQLQTKSEEQFDNHIALCILPLEHKILPNSYFYKRNLYRGQKNTNKLSSALLKKNFYLNILNKQKSDQKLVSCYPGVDTELVSNFKLLNLKRKKIHKIMTSSSTSLLSGNKKNQRGWNFKKSKKTKLLEKDQSFSVSMKNRKNLYKQKFESFSKRNFSQVTHKLPQFTSEIYFSSYPVYFSNFFLTADFSKDFYYKFNKVNVRIYSSSFSSFFPDEKEGVSAPLETPAAEGYAAGGYLLPLQSKASELQFCNLTNPISDPLINDYKIQNQSYFKKIYLKALQKENWNQVLTVSLSGKFAFFANQRFGANYWTNQYLKNLIKPTSLSVSQMFSNFPVFRNTILSNSFDSISKNQIFGFTSFFSPLVGEIISSQTNIWLKNMSTQALVLSNQNLFSVSLSFDPSYVTEQVTHENCLDLEPRFMKKDLYFKKLVFSDIREQEHQNFLNSEKSLKKMYEKPILKENEIVVEHNNKLYKVKNLPIGYARVFKPLRLGSILKYGTPIVPDYNMSKAGQIIHIGSYKITLRHAQIFLASSKSILHVKPGEFIYPNAAVLTLPFQTLKTGDIVQGIPKVEQYFEARETKAGRLFSGSLPNLLHCLFKRYRSFLSRELAVRKSILKIQQILVDGVQRVYRSQGVDIIDKHLEVIVRQMTSRVQIVHPGQTAFFPGELMDLTFIELINPYLFKPIKYVPIILGITRASLEVDSFLSAASFQHTVKILSKAALYRKKDFLKGLKENLITANLIRAGTGYFLYSKKL